MRTRTHLSRSVTDSSRTDHTRGGPGRPHAEVRRILHTPRVQAKLTIGEPGDAFEQEADRVADRVMRMSEPPAVSSAPETVQRLCDECEEEKEQEQEKEKDEKEYGVVQRECDDCEEEIQAKPEPGAAVRMPDGFGRGFSALRGGGQPLPAAERSFFEPRFGTDFDDVRLHSGSAAGTLARSVHARAFTLHDSIVFGPNQYAPGTSAGRRLLAHELTHVVQQRGGVPSTRVQRQGGDVAPGEVAETEKDDPPVAALSIGLMGAIFMPPADAKFRKGLKNPQMLGIVLKTLLGQEYTTELRDKIVRDWNATGRPVFNTPEGQTSFSPAEIQGEQATEGAPIGRITWAPIGFKQLLKRCADAGKPVKLSAEQERLLELGEAALRAFPHVTSLPPWFKRSLFVAVMANRAALLEDLAKAIKKDALPAGPDMASGPLAQLAIQEIEKSLADSAAVVDEIRKDTTLVLHPGYQALWPPLKTRGSPGWDQPAPESRAPKEFPAAVLITYADARPALAQAAFSVSSERKRLLDGFVMALKYRKAAEGEGFGAEQQLAESPAQAYTAPPYPSTLSVYPALDKGLWGSTRADYGFQMALQFPDIAAAFQFHDYDFAKFRVPDDKFVNVAQALTGPGTAPSHWEMLKKRLAQDERYHEADVRAYGDSLWNQLGPPGISIINPINIVAAMRVLGTVIGTLFETLADPSYVARFNFEEEGLYIVRCVATWPVRGDVALRRPPSVAYVLMFARDPGILAEQHLAEQLEQETEAKGRITEIDKLLENDKLTEKRRTELETEKKRLVAGTGSVEGMLLYQQEMLKTSTDKSATERSEKLEEILDTRKKRGFDASAKRLPAVYVNDAGQMIDLLLELKVISEDSGTGTGEYQVNDATTPSSTSSSSHKGNRRDAIVEALNDLFKHSDYGRGHASVRVDGVLESIEIPTVSGGKLFMEALSDTATILSVIAIAAAPFTGGSSIALMMPAMVIGAVPSAYNIINRAIDHTFHVDLALAMDIVNVVGALVGVGAETRAGMQAIRLGTTTGRVIIVTGIGAMAGGVVLMPVALARQIDALQDMPEGLRGAAVMKAIGQFMVSAGIMVGGMLVAMSRGRTEFEPRNFEDWLSQIDEGTRNKLEATKTETKPEFNLWKIYSEMDPFVRELLTQCGSDCIPMNPPPSALDQARIKKLDVGLSPEAHRKLKGLLHDNRGPVALDGVLQGIEAARAKAAASKKNTKVAVEKAILARASAADYILANFTEQPVEAMSPTPGKWQRVRALANQVATKLGGAGVTLETIGKILDRVRSTAGEDPEEILGLLNQLGDIAPAVQGLPELLGGNGLTGHFNFYKGARWTLRFLRDRNLWSEVARFEEPAPGPIINRAIDVRLIDGTRLEMKSWAEWHDMAPQNFSRQIMADYLDTGGFLSQQTVWIFEAGPAIDKGTLLENMTAALDRALRERWRGYDDPGAPARVADIKRQLPLLIQVGLH